MRLKLHDGIGFGRMLVAVGKGEAAKWGREKLPRLVPEQGQILWPCYEVGQRQQRQRERGSAPDGSSGCAGQSAVPAARSDPPRLQAVGAGQRGGGEEDFSSQLNLLENLACSPSR